MTSRLSRLIAAEIRVQMVRRRETALGLAPVLGRSQNYLSTRLRDEASFTIDDLDALAKHFGMSPVTIVQNAEGHAEVIDAMIRAEQREKKLPRAVTAE